MASPRVFGAFLRRRLYPPPRLPLIRLARRRASKVDSGVRGETSSSLLFTKNLPSSSSEVLHLIRLSSASSAATATMGQENDEEDDKNVTTEGIARLTEELAAIRATPEAARVAGRHHRPRADAMGRREEGKGAKDDDDDNAAAAGVVPNPTPIQALGTSTFASAVHPTAATTSSLTASVSPSPRVIPSSPRRSRAESLPSRAGGRRQDCGALLSPDNLPHACVQADDPATGDKVIAKVEYGLRGLLACVHMFFGRPLKIPDLLMIHIWIIIVASACGVGQSEGFEPERERVIAAHLREKAGGGPKDPRLFDDVKGWLPQWMHRI